ncbi:DUF6069 family protein [Plantactinospora sp. KBS50]|uniref:DUF6069 family protein n=1 Tax=Plantactinospora sp. KBS50 TaxID=2024580 RepID=UPI000BAB16BC|nr:DUF6069 family protein [Plantactinospora sp. KBS50]ASW52956.1 hypothetical protein CIK06_00270 [Plantactinospora sp. KBS50]
MSTASATTAAPTWRSRLLAVGVTTAATLVGWLVLAAFVDLRARTGGTEQTVGAVAVVATTLLAGLAGWGLLALLERRAGRARALWTGIAVAVAVLSLAGPLVQGVGGAAKLALAALHVITAAVLIPLLRRTTAG